MNSFMQDLLSCLRRDHQCPMISVALVDIATKSFEISQSLREDLSKEDKEKLYEESGECSHGTIGPCCLACDNLRGLPESSIIKRPKPKDANAASMLRTLIRYHGPRRIVELLEKELKSFDNPPSVV